MSDPARAGRPRLIEILAPELGPPEQWPTLLERMHRLGFSTVVLGQAFATASIEERDADGALLGDLERLNPALELPELSPGLERLAQACQAHALELVLDVGLDRALPNSRILKELAPTMPRDDRPLNPRRADFGRAGVALPWHDTALADRLLASIVTFLNLALAQGVAGFRLRGLSRLSTKHLQGLIGATRADHAQALWIADTLGLPAEQVEHLAGCGFSGGIASLPWWDFKSPWLVDEFARLASLGQTLCPIDAPNVAEDAALLRQRLMLAAGISDGLLMSLKACEALAGDGAKALLSAVNQWLASAEPPAPAARLTLCSPPGSPITVLGRAARHELLLVAINWHPRPQAIGVDALMRQLERPAAGLVEVGLDGASHGQTLGIEVAVQLDPGQMRFLRPERLPPIMQSRPSRPSQRRILEKAIDQPRIAIEAVSPSCDDGRFSVRAQASSTLEIGADVYCDGHDQLAVYVQWRATDRSEWSEARMERLVNDRYRGQIVLERLGGYEFRIIAWIDQFASWLSDTEKKRTAGRDLTLDLAEGCALVAAAAKHSGHAALKQLDEALHVPEHAAEHPAAGTASERLALLLAPLTRTLMHAAEVRLHLSMSATYPVDAERRAAYFASWYELFPRSLSKHAGQHGTFADVIDHLPRIAAMGFDVLYFPPIHPIGRTHRKGRNNQLTASANDPGSPYAIGSSEGGHDAVHPELGTLEDFRALLAAARQHDLEIALDFAIQCSPDHPWLKSHPAWFKFRADGSLRYAENPPKTYEDIVNVDFYSERSDDIDPNPAAALWQALRDVVLFWVSLGVRIFRVDNPHTKPLPFWQWMIGEVRARHPDTLFLAEAFTAPKMMARLAKIGFTQSYTYFTWRNTKAEIATYLGELNQAPLREVFRPNFFVNTPDINPFFLQTAGRPGFLIRAALATTLSGLWGMYSGFELCEAAALPSKEEYLDSEKYQLRQRDFTQPGHIIGEITQLNAIRRANPALMTHLGVTFYLATNEAILYFAKATPTRDNVVLVAINLDPWRAQECDIELPLWEWGLHDDAQLVADDLIEGHHFTWTGKRQRLRIDPQYRPYNIWRIAPPAL